MDHYTRCRHTLVARCATAAELDPIFAPTLGFFKAMIKFLVITTPPPPPPLLPIPPPPPPPPPPSPTTDLGLTGTMMVFAASPCRKTKLPYVWTKSTSGSSNERPPSADPLIVEYSTVTETGGGFKNTVRRGDSRHAG